MAKIKLGDNEYTIKFGYKSTLKANVLSRLVKTETNINSGAAEGIEDFLLFIPELLLAGLQKYHSEEFGYDLDTGEGKTEQLEKAFDLMDSYVDDGGDISELYQSLQEELQNNSFLSQMLAKMTAEEKSKAPKTKIKKAAAN